MDVSALLVAAGHAVPYYRYGGVRYEVEYKKRSSINEGCTKACLKNPRVIGQGVNERHY